MTTIKDDVENIVASACDGTWNGLERAYFPEHNNPPQKLADKVTVYIENLVAMLLFRPTTHKETDR